MAKDVQKRPQSYVIKATGAVELSEPTGRLTLNDRKLFNFLLGHAYEGLCADKSEFSVSLSHIRNFAAAARDGAEEVDNRRIKDSVKRLQQVTVEFNSLDSDKGNIWQSSPLLGDVTLVERTGDLTYSFTPRVAQKLVEPALYSYISLKISYQFTTKYGLILYEILKRYSDRDAASPWLAIRTTELRDLLGCRDKLRDYKDLRKCALDPAITEINELAEFEVEIDETRQGGGRGGGKVLGLVFHVKRKDRQAAEKAVRELGKPRAQRRGEKAVEGDQEMVSKALRFLDSADVPTRFRWQKEAETMGVKLPPAATARENLALWVPAIAKVICRTENLR